MYKFKVGDRVVSKVRAPEWLTSIKVGTTGTVVDVKSEGMSLGVHWDFDPKSNRAHSCSGKCPEGYGWYVRAAEVELEVALPEIEPIDISMIASFVCGGVDDGI